MREKTENQWNSFMLVGVEDTLRERVGEVLGK